MRNLDVSLQGFKFQRVPAFEFLLGFGKRGGAGRGWVSG